MRTSVLRPRASGAAASLRAGSEGPRAAAVAVGRRGASGRSGIVGSKRSSSSSE